MWWSSPNDAVARGVPWWCGPLTRPRRWTARWVSSTSATTRRKRGGTCASWIAKWQGKDPKLLDWVESNIEETLTLGRLPAQAGLPWAHHKHRKSTNRLERLSEEIRHHTRVVRIFPNAESCLPWERGLPGRIERSRQGCRRWQGGLRSQTHCLSHGNVFAPLDGHHPHWRGHPVALAARHRRAHGRRMEAVAKLAAGTGG